MNKGEFEKRLLNSCAMNIVKDEWVWKMREDGGGPYVEARKEILELIEEARKEFPLVVEVDFAGKEWHEVAVIMEQKNLERKAWFEKWFGDSK